MKGFVLCAGMGTRLGGLVREIPKPMLPIGERPMLAFIISHLARHGVCDLVINLHYRAETIVDFFGDGSDWGVRIEYSHEPQLLGTAGAVRKVLERFGDEPLLVQYGDVVTNHDLSSLISLREQRDADAALLVHERLRSNSVVALDSQQRVTAFLERPTETVRRTVESPWVNSGIAVIRPRLLDHLTAGEPADLPRDIYQPLAGSGRLVAQPLDGFRCAVDSPERLLLLRNAAAEGVVECLH